MKVDISENGVFSEWSMRPIITTAARASGSWALALQYWQYALKRRSTPSNAGGLGLCRTMCISGAGEGFRGRFGVWQLPSVSPYS
jgi:hypothetical protein